MKQVTPLPRVITLAVSLRTRKESPCRYIVALIFMRRDRAKAKVAVARHLLVRTYIMLRDEIDYAEFLRRGVAVPSARVSYRPQVPDKLIERRASEQQPG